MTKSELNALLMKISTTYDIASKHIECTKYNVYEITRSIINLIEQNNGKKLSVKRNFKLLRGDKDGKASS